MKVDFYLIVNSNCTTRVNRRPPALDWNEVSILLKLELPDKIFQKPTLQASITIPEEAVTKSPITAEVVDNVKSAIEQTTGLKFSIKVEEQPGEVSSEN